jgi:hypothetical protein
MTNKIIFLLIGVLLLGTASNASAQRFDTNTQSLAYDDMAAKNKANLGEIGG